MLTLPHFDAKIPEKSVREISENACLKKCAYLTFVTTQHVNHRTKKACRRALLERRRALFFSMHLHKIYPSALHQRKNV